MTASLLQTTETYYLALIINGKLNRKAFYKHANCHSTSDLFTRLVNIKQIPLSHSDQLVFFSVEQSK